MWQASWLPFHVCQLQVSKYDDPQEAAIAVVVEAYRLWLQYEVRTDDITLVVARIEGLLESAALMNKQSMRCDLQQNSRSSGMMLGMPLHPHAHCAAEEGPMCLAKLCLVEHCAPFG